MTIRHGACQLDRHAQQHQEHQQVFGFVKGSRWPCYDSLGLRVTGGPFRENVYEQINPIDSGPFSRTASSAWESRAFRIVQSSSRAITDSGLISTRRPRCKTESRPSLMKRRTWRSLHRKSRATSRTVRRWHGIQLGHGAWLIPLLLCRCVAGCDTREHPHKGDKSGMQGIEVMLWSWTTKRGSPGRRLYR